jgi:hypothetical protein
LWDVFRREWVAGFLADVSVRKEFNAEDAETQRRALARRPALHYCVTSEVNYNACGPFWLEELYGYALGTVAYGDQGD